MAGKDVLKLAEKTVKELFEIMKINDLVEVEYELLEKEEGNNLVKISLKGNDLGFMIGYRGRHLESMQYILALLISKKLGEGAFVNVLLDAGGYLDDKIKRIERIAIDKADDSRIAGEEVHLEPMNSFERRIVHTVISKFDDITTRSEGEGRDRHIVIIPKSDEEIGIDFSGDPEEEEDQEE